MGYLNNSGSGFLSNAVTTVSNVKSYLVNKTGYLVDSIRVGIGDFGQRVLDDGGTVEASAEAAASYREITKDIYDQASLVLFPSGYKDNLLYSHKPVNGSGDFTYTRGTDTATRVGADGYIKKERANLLVQSNQFDTTWVINTSVSEGEEGYDGTTDAWSLTRAVGGALMGKQTVSLSGVSTYSIYAKINTNNGIGLALGGLSIAARFDLRDATKTQAVTETGIISSSQKYVGNGFYRLSITANVSGSIEARIYLTTADATTSDSNGGTHIIQDAQVEEGLVATPYIETTTAPVYEGLTDNLPRIDYTGGTPSILLEPSRTNLLTHSEWIGGWSPVNDATIDTPQEFTLNSTGARLQAGSIGSPSGNFVFYAVFDSADIGKTIRLSYYDATAGGWNFGSNITIDSNGRAERIISTGSNVVGNVAFYGTSTSQSFTLKYCQFEAGSYPTSYIPTYGSSATRNQDQASFTIDAATTSWSVFMDVKNWTDVSNSGQFFFRNIADTTNSLFYYGACFGVQESVGQQYSCGKLSNYEVYNGKFAVTYDGVNTVKIYIDGVLRDTITTADTAKTAGIDGGNLYYAGSSASKEIKSLLVFSTTLTDDECIALTAP